MELFLLSVVFIFALIFGSFLNCLIWRLKSNESVWGRSYCPKCRKQISWYDNIPLFSFAFLKGKCRNCKKKISWQYPLVEFFFALIILFLFVSLEPSLNLFKILSYDFLNLFLRDFIFIFILAVIFVYDFNWQEVPMLILWPGIAIMIFFSWFFGVNIFTILIATALSASFFLAQFLLTKGRGIGEGDIWIGALIGARLISLGDISLAIFSSYMIGASVAIFLLIRGKKKIKSKLPLGPFLVLGTLISLFFSEAILNWYFSLVIF